MGHKHGLIGNLEGEVHSLRSPAAPRGVSEMPESGVNGGTSLALQGAREVEEPARIPGHLCSPNPSDPRAVLGCGCGAAVTQPRSQIPNPINSRGLGALGSLSISQSVQQRGVCPSGRSKAWKFLQMGFLSPAEGWTQGRDGAGASWDSASTRITLFTDKPKIYHLKT